MIQSIQVYKETIQEHEQTLIEDALSSQPLPEKEKLITTLSDYVGAGKHVRGGLYLKGRSWWEDLSDKDYRIAACIELLHSAMLIQDDIMDDDEQRRNMPSLHVQFQSFHDEHRIHEGMAVCVADLLIFQAMTTLAETDAGTAVQAGDDIREVTFAQFRDVTHGDPWSEGVEPTVKDILNLHRNKTGRYTFGLPLSAALKRSGRSPTPNLLQLCEALGVIYQLRDDELNVFGQSKTTGKSSLSDVWDNKRTILRHLVINEHPSVEPLFGTTLSEKDRETLLAAFEDVRSAHDDYKERFIGEAKSRIVDSDLPASAKKELKALTEYIAERER